MLLFNNIYNHWLSKSLNKETNILVNIYIRLKEGVGRVSPL